jgi:hypothetical protein
MSERDVTAREIDALVDVITRKVLEELSGLRIGDARRRRGHHAGTTATMPRRGAPPRLGVSAVRGLDETHAQAGARASSPRSVTVPHDRVRISSHPLS